MHWAHIKPAVPRRPNKPGPLGELSSPVNPPSTRSCRLDRRRSTGSRRPGGPVTRGRTHPPAHEPEPGWRRSGWTGLARHKAASRAWPRCRG